MMGGARDKEDLGDLGEKENKEDYLCINSPLPLEPLEPLEPLKPLKLPCSPALF
jgi:hypothetical protein